MMYDTGLCSVILKLLTYHISKHGRNPYHDNECSKSNNCLEFTFKNNFVHQWNTDETQQEKTIANNLRALFDVIYRARELVQCVFLPLCSSNIRWFKSQEWHPLSWLVHTTSFAQFQKGQNWLGDGAQSWPLPVWPEGSNVTGTVQEALILPHLKEVLHFLLGHIPYTYSLTIHVSYPQTKISLILGIYVHVLKQPDVRKQKGNSLRNSTIK